MSKFEELLDDLISASKYNEFNSFAGFDRNSDEDMFKAELLNFAKDVDGLLKAIYSGVTGNVIVYDKTNIRAMLEDIDNG